MPLLEVYERTTTRTFRYAVDRPVPLLTCTPADPFVIDDPCTSASGHYPVSSCGAVVCVHCSKVFWQ